MLSEIVIEQQCLKTEHKLCSIIHTTQGSLSTFTVLDRQGIVGNILYLQYRILGLYNLKRDVQYIYLQLFRIFNQETGTLSQKKPESVTVADALEYFLFCLHIDGPEIRHTVL